MNKKLLIALVIGLTFTACTNTKTPAPAPVYQAPTDEKMAKFLPVMTEVGKSTKKDANYHRIALDTDANKNWFKLQSYRLWDKQITKEQFVSDGVAKFPGHAYEFNFIADGFQARS